MDKETKLVNKVKRLLKRLGCPRWLHHFRPKEYELYQHIVALLVKLFCRLSYRRTVQLLDMFGIDCPSKSALQDRMYKIPSWLWSKAIEVTSGLKNYLVALDSTGLSRTNPSYYYLRRIDGKIPKISVRLNAAFNTQKKKWCAAKVRILPVHEVKDSKYLLKECNARIVVADKAYDAE